MRRLLLFLLIFICFTAITCKKKEKIPEPGYVLQKWSKAIKELDYTNYRKCVAYPKSEVEFREMYKKEFFIDIMAVNVGEVDNDNIRKDHKDNSFKSCSVFFQGAVIKRKADEPYQIIRGDVLFVQFIDGERKKDGWLISNRTIIRVNK